MDRSLDRQGANKPHHRKNLASSYGFRKIFKNRNNHENNLIPFKDISLSRYVQREEAIQSQIQSMKEFVKTFRKEVNEKPTHQRKNTDHIEKPGSPVSQRSAITSYSKRSERPKSKQTVHSRVTNERKIQDFQKRVQNLLEQKLNITKLKKTCPESSSKQGEDEVSEQLKNLIQDIRQFRDDNEGKEGYNEAITNIGKKISILQKMLAENYSESEFFKKSFYNARSIRKSLLPVSKKYTLCKSGEILRRMSSSTTNGKPTIDLQSTSYLSYKKPEKKAYEKNSLSQSKYSVNRQPVPPSSYTRDFLNYGSLPKYTHENSYSFVPNNLSSCHKSYYGAQFKEKRTLLLNPKELDCTNDKIKRLKVSFIPEKNQTGFKKGMKVQKSFQTKENNSQNLNLKTVAKTEFRREYSKKGVVIENPIKNKKLGNMKQNFKNCIYC